MLSIHSPHFAVLKDASVSDYDLDHISTPIPQFYFHSYCTSTKSSAFANSNHHSNSTCLLISDPHIHVFQVGLEGALNQLTHYNRAAD